jgi:hypothetical protein
LCRNSATGLPPVADSCEASQSNCSASLARPVFITSELRPIKHQPAEHGAKDLQVTFRNRLRRHWADLGRVVADIVIAGQIAAGNRKRRVPRLGEFEVVAIGRTIEGEVTAVDDEIGSRGADIFAHPVKIVGQLLMAAGEVGIGNLGQAKFGHARLLAARSYICDAPEW